MKIKINSKLVTPGDTFVALVGNNKDGHDYILDAINNGATKIVCNKGEYSVETHIVKDTYLYLTNYLKDNYYDLIKDIKLIGMTGTNGKTTSCYLIYEALCKLGIKACYIGTIGFYMDNTYIYLNNTTPDIVTIYELLLKARSNGCTYCVMELDTLMFNYAVFTNLTRDHLDYHIDMKSYALAKQKLFYKLKHSGKAVINIDDDYKSFFLVHNNNITYGIEDGDIKIDKYNFDINGTTFYINGDKFTSKLIGKYNLYNLLVVITILLDIGLDIEKVIEVVAKLNPPSGRMELVPFNNNVAVVDYAHTPDAVKNIVSTFNEVEHNKIYVVIGCGGNRDKTKRPLMGIEAVNVADYVIFTSDNPRDERPIDIINDIVSNLDTSNYEIVINRDEAIIKGIQLCDKNDILLVLGKGHEQYQEVNGVKNYFSDIKIIKDNI